MEREDKLVDDYDLVPALSQVEGTEEALPATVNEAAKSGTLAMQGAVLGAIRMILDRQTVSIVELRLPAQESQALEALQAATTGRGSLAEFVYASDRSELLEQALAVLQPNLIGVDETAAHELHAQLADISDRVGALREVLTSLDDAQDEVLEAGQKAALEAAAAAAAGDKSDKPTPSPDPDAPRPASTLTGPERKEPPKPASALAGPERTEPPRPASTLTGPDLPETPPPPTTLLGPEIPERPPAASTLGDGVVEGPPPANPSDKRRPWWRRPFG